MNLIPDYSKLRKIGVIITLLHIGLMVIFFYLNISTPYYSVFFLSFSIFIMSQIIKNNSLNLNKLHKRAAVITIVSAAYLYFPKSKNIYVNYIWAILVIILGAYAATKTIKNNKNVSSEKNKDYFLFYLLVFTFIFTIVLNIIIIEKISL